MIFSILLILKILLILLILFLWKYFKFPVFEMYWLTVECTTTVHIWPNLGLIWSFDHNLCQTCHCCDYISIPFWIILFLTDFLKFWFFALWNDKSSCMYVWMCTQQVAYTIVESTFCTRGKFYPHCQVSYRNRGKILNWKSH